MHCRVRSKATSSSRHAGAHNGVVKLWDVRKSVEPIGVLDTLQPAQVPWWTLLSCQTMYVTLASHALCDLTYQSNLGPHASLHELSRLQP